MTKTEATAVLNDIRSGKIKPGEIHEMDVDIDRLSHEELKTLFKIRAKQSKSTDLSIEEQSFLELLPMKFTFQITES